jgi:hypothetical protein|tara:strand:+ start:6166 stop:7443 length:1278 start_codon:yes stop_codon:yes gene_type:complete
MTTRNFRVNNGLEVGDIVVSASANTITGGATAAPSADGQFANKKYVDDSIAALSTTSIAQLNSNVTVTDAGTGKVEITVDGTEVADFATAATTITATGAINLSAGSDVVIPTNIGLHFTDANEKIESNGTDLTVNAGADINLTATNDVNIPADVGITFGDDGEKIEGDGTDLTISTSGALNINNTGTCTVSGALTVTGDLTVNGTTSTVNSTNTTIADNLIELQSGISAGSNDSGIIIERGSTGNNAAIIWDESADKFTMGTTTATAADKSGGISVSVATLVANLEGTATAAQYSDVAERFASDSVYSPGTVVALGGAEEITQVNEEASDEVFGVVSSLEQAAFKMNDGAGNNDTHPYIAMTGRVDVKVIGQVNKGDRLISASVPGYARAATKTECTAFNVIGRALTSKSTAGQGSVLAAVRVSH